MIRRGVWLTGAWWGGGLGAVVALAATAVLSTRAIATHPGATASGSTSGARAEAEKPLTGDDGRSHAFRIPSGRAPSLTCEAARAVVAQARQQLGYPPEPVEAHALAEAAADWLDPFGLWSVAPDAPIAAAFARRAAALSAELEGKGPSARCDSARAIGESLVGWVRDLRTVFDEARIRAPLEEDSTVAVYSPAFEGATVTRPARSLAATLGRRLGRIERDFGAAARPYVESARARYFPALDADGWAGVVLAAAVRAYVPAIDPHGAWAPLDEESSVYEIDLEARPPTRPWEKAERTAIGLRIDAGATPPLADGDVLLSIAGLATAGLSYEQMEQLGYAASDARPPAEVVVLRPGEKLPRTTWLDASGEDPKATSAAGDDAEDLPVERIEYGDGDAIVVAIHDVRDDLGDELTRALLHERDRGGRAIAGVVLDLRGNGGGSTDGAIDALGLFVPGAALFPMRRRDGAIETDRAPEPPNVDRWRGPVATLVDGDTASAAEMIAGALGAYRRGPTVGATTFGKGCAQEYIDDDAHAGVLRLTTLLYALPDGTPVQRVGLLPSVRFPFGTSDPSDRESALGHAPPQWRGPDVRDRAILAHAEDGTWTTAWPPSGGNVGPCKDSEVCRALRVLGAAAPTARRASRTGHGAAITAVAKAR